MWVLLFSVEASHISFEVSTFNLGIVLEIFKQYRTLGILFQDGQLYNLQIYEVVLISLGFYWSCFINVRYLGFCFILICLICFALVCFVYESPQIQRGRKLFQWFSTWVLLAFWETVSII